MLECLPARVEALVQGLKAIVHPSVHEVRHCGLIAGIELRQESGERFPEGEHMGERVCLAARAHGLLTRPIRDTIVMMPPLCSTAEEIAGACEALGTALGEG